MATLQAIDCAVSLGTLDSYRHWASQVPMLEAEEEKALAERWIEKQDMQAAKQMVLSHLRFVIRVARGYAGYGLPEADLIQEGNIGLMKAVKRFNPTLGVRLVSFAVHWIKAEIHEFILKNWRIVKIATTKAQRKLFFNLRSAKKRLGWFTHEEVKAVAQDLGVTQKDVLEMEARLNAHDIPVDVDDDDDDGSIRALAPIQYLEAPLADPAEMLENDNFAMHGSEQLYLALKTLDPRSQDILKMRWLNDKKATLHDLAAKYKISAERIRQLEKNAMDKLKASLLDVCLVNEV